MLLLSKLQYFIFAQFKEKKKEEKGGGLARLSKIAVKAMR